MSDTFTRKSSYTKEDLIQSGETGLFGEGNAKLPAPPMLMMDRVTEMTLDGGKAGKGSLRAELDIDPSLWFFQCHFIGDPVMPGCLGLDAMWQGVGFWLGWSGSPGRGRALGVGRVKFTGQVTNDIKTVRYEIDITKVKRGKLILGIADGKLFADDKLIYTADDMRVGLFTPEQM